MWTSAAVQGRRLGLLTKYQKHILLNGSSQPSYSVVAAMRSKHLQDSRISSQMLCSRFLSTSFIHSENQPADSKASAAIKTPSDTSSANQSAGATNLLHSALCLPDSDSGMAKGDPAQLGDDRLSTAAAGSPDASPPSSPPQSSEGRRRSSGLPVRSHGLAPYVAASEDLRRLVALGVDISSWDRRPGIPQLVLRLNWEQDMAPRIQLLHDAGVPADRLAAFITSNPLIFKERIDDLQVRLNYLEAKWFSRDQVASIVCRDPFWLMFSTARIDRRLGLFVGMFGLKPLELRQLAAKCPSLITSNIQHIKDSVFTIRKEFGFDREELKQILMGSRRC